MKTYTLLEIAVEVAWQLGDANQDIPRAESRWSVVNIALEIEQAGIIDDNSEDIDEIIFGYLQDKGYLA